MSGPTGSQRVLELLRDRRWHTLAEIEAECRVEGRSRLSDLRRLGHVLERRRNPGGMGKAKYSHRLAQTALERSLQDESLEEAEALTVGAGFGSASSNDDVAPNPLEEHGASVRAAGEELEDAGWRDLFPAESLGEALPPPSCEQLPLLDEAAV